MYLLFILFDVGTYTYLFLIFIKNCIRNEITLQLLAEFKSANAIIVENLDS